MGMLEKIPELAGTMKKDFSKDFWDSFIDNYNGINALDYVQFMMGGMITPRSTNATSEMSQYLALYIKFLTSTASFAGMSDPESSISKLDVAATTLGELKKQDPNAYEDYLNATAEGDETTQKKIMFDFLTSTETGKDVANLMTVIPETVQKMTDLGVSLENSNISSPEQLQDYQDIMQKMAELQNSINEYNEKYNTQEQTMNNGTIQQDSEMESNQRAIYEKSEIAVDKNLAPENAKSQSLQHGQEFEQAGQEVGDEELASAEKVAKEREISTENGAVSLVMGNSEKVKVTIEPYIEGDQASRNAMEENSRQANEKQQDTQLESDTKEK